MTKMIERHSWLDDGSGVSCKHCPLPRRHRVHSTPPPRPRAEPTAGSRLPRAPTPRPENVVPISVAASGVVGSDARAVILDAHDTASKDFTDHYHRHGITDEEAGQIANMPTHTAERRSADLRSIGALAEVSAGHSKITRIGLRLLATARASGSNTGGRA